MQKFVVLIIFFLVLPGNIDIPSLTFPICQRNVDRWVNVTEEEIADAIFLMVDIHHEVMNLVHFGSVLQSVPVSGGCALSYSKFLPPPRKKM